MFNSTLKALREHEKWRSSCINLVASENILSPACRRALTSDMGHRYFFKVPYDASADISYQYRGTRYIDEVCETGEKLAKEVFGAPSAYLHALSGHMSNITMLLAFTRPGDDIMCTDPKGGGYPGLAQDKLPEHFGLKAHYFPFDPYTMQIDVERSTELIEEIKPKFLIFSAAITIFPQPVEDISKVCKDTGTVVCYDASHPLGLIAGKEFQDPLREGADIMVGSTHKTFPGPQGGIILDRGLEVLEEVNHFVSVDNPHFNRIAAMTVALSEMKEFGEEYARKVIENAKALARYLEEWNVKVDYKDRGYTRSHQIRVREENYAEFTARLEQANIMVDNSGRIGTQEITRLGAGDKEMKEIAEFMGRVHCGDDIGKVKAEVIEWRKNFQTVDFCFDEE